MAEEKDIPSEAQGAPVPSAPTEVVKVPAAPDPHIILKELDKDAGAAPQSAPAAAPVVIQPAAVSAAAPAEDVISDAMRRLDQILQDIKESTPTK